MKILPLLLLAITWMQVGTNVFRGVEPMKTIGSLIGIPSTLSIIGFFYDKKAGEYVQQEQIIDKSSAIRITIDALNTLSIERLSEGEAKPFLKKNVSFATQVFVKITLQYSDGATRTLRAIGGDTLIFEGKVYKINKNAMDEDINEVLWRSVFKGKPKARA